MNKTDMNLLQRYQEIHKERANQLSPGKIYVSILVITFLLLGAFTLRLWFEKTSLEQSVSELNAFVSDPGVLARVKEVETLRNNISSLDTMISQTKGINAVFDSAVRFDDQPFFVLQSKRYTGITFESVSYSKGIVYLGISGTRPSDFSNYVLRLMREMYFKDVNYSGYTYDLENNVYRSIIRCTMYGGNQE